MSLLIQSYKLSFIYALRELRGGIYGFGIFIACLAIGVAAISGAGSLNQAIKQGVENNSQVLLGGDLQASLTYRDITDEEFIALDRFGDVSSQVSMRSMARVFSNDSNDSEATARSLIALKAVDSLYPLYGELELNNYTSLDQILGNRNGEWGVAIDPSLVTRLSLEIGDSIKVGESFLQVRAVINKEPDRVISFAAAGPRVILLIDALESTELVQPGSMITYKYNVRFDREQSFEDVKAELEENFPEAGWRLRGLKQAARSLEVFLDNITLFLTLVGLTSLLTGGIGVANAARYYLMGRMKTIATLKCLGAKGDFIFNVYAIQFFILAFLGICIGLSVGASIPFVTSSYLSQVLPVEASLGFYPNSLIKAMAFGFLVSSTFAIWSLAQARDVSPIFLFRSFLGDISKRIRIHYIFILIVLGILLCSFTVFTSERSQVAFFFVIGAFLSLSLFYLSARVVIFLAKKVSKNRKNRFLDGPVFRLGLANLCRPGNPTISVVLSVGLGLSVMICTSLIEANLSKQINGDLPKEAPSMFFIDIQPSQTGLFEQTISSQLNNNSKLKIAQMIRGRIVSIDGIPVEDAVVSEEARWALRGDRGISQSDTLPEDSVLIKGEWWSSNHEGDNLLSIDANVARGMGLDIGDSLTVNILGRNVTGIVANFREVRWQSGSMNFMLIFSPNALKGAPGSYIATVQSPPGTEEQIEKSVVDAMPNVTVIQIRAALLEAEKLLVALATSVRLALLIALVSGVLVLAGAIASGNVRRVYESIVMKVLGATRINIVKAFALEYTILGISTGLIAAVVGCLSSWALLKFVMRIDWYFFPQLILLVILICVLITMFAGLAGVWMALGTKPSNMLRNE